MLEERTKPSEDGAMEDDAMKAAAEAAALGYTNPAMGTPMLANAAYDPSMAAAGGYGMPGGVPMPGNMGMGMQPGMGMQQPGMGMQQPGMGMQQPGMGMQQPGMGGMM